MSNPNSPTILSTIDGIVVRHLTPYGDLLFAGRAGSGNHWQIFDVSDATRPRSIASLDIPEGACAARGSLVYHAADDALRVIDISNPGDPTIISQLYPGYGLDVAVDSTFAYVARENGLTIVDVADPGAPSVVSELQTHLAVRELDLLMPYVYMSANFGLDIVDVSDREAPFIAGTVELPWGASWGVVFAPPYAYVAGGASFQVLDISNPIAPVLVSLIETSVELSRFTATPQTDAILIEWSTSLEFQHLGFRLLRRSMGEEYRSLTTGLIPPPGPYEFLDRDVIPDVVYEYVLEAVDRQGGIQRFGPVSARAPRATSLRLASWPNPFSSADLPVQIRADVPAANSLTLDVFDVSGRMIRNLWEGRAAPGHRIFQWDGRDARGLVVPSGVYFYRLISSGRSAQASIVFVR